jgi:CubicO group peptidase (beta-lactamase class C family)
MFKYFIQKLFFGVTLFAMFLSNIACGQTKADKIEKLIKTYNEYGLFNGSVLIAQQGKIVYKNGFGYANIEWNIPNQTDTKFRLGSITKQFTSMLIVMLAAENKINLDAPISTYLPDYPKKNGNIITIHHLLTHTSGIPNFTSFPEFYKRDRYPVKQSEFVNFFADSALLFKPGEKFDYCNSNYFLLGLIIENVTGKSYENFLKEKILTPLKMNNTGYEHNRTILKNMASGYDKNGRSYLNGNYLDMSIPFSAGALYSTVEDLYLWDQALYNENFIPKKFLDKIYSKYIEAFDNYYGYGWIVGDIQAGNSGKRFHTFSHTGSINGFSSILTRILFDKSLIVLLNNTGSAPLNDMTIAITGILNDESFEAPKKSMANELMNTIEKDGLANALLYYNENKNSNSFLIVENEMNQAGYELLQSDRAREAAEIFKLNVEAFPASSNVYDSYGEALLALGRKDMAIENYKKSYQLDPGNMGALKILKEAGINPDSVPFK